MSSSRAASAKRTTPCKGPSWSVSAMTPDQPGGLLDKLLGELAPRRAERANERAVRRRGTEPRCGREPSGGEVPSACVTRQGLSLPSAGGSTSGEGGRLLTPLHLRPGRRPVTPATRASLSNACSIYQEGVEGREWVHVQSPDRRPADLARRLDELIREKAATRELDAIAAQRRRLPMVEMGDYTLIGADGPVRLWSISSTAIRS